MPDRIDACFYIKEPPEIEFREGMFHICQWVGAWRFERVMSPHVFMLALKRAQTALELYHGGATVIDFKRHA